jgi:hypothetical protein
MSNGASFNTTVNNDSFRENKLLPSFTLFGQHEPIQLTDEFKSRLAEAARASIVSLITISLILIPGQHVLPVPWIGNVLAITCLKPTLGDTLLATMSVVVPLLPISLIGYGVSTLLDTFDTTTYAIVLPFVVMLGSLSIMLCPWPMLTMKNLMLIVSYLIVSSPLSLRTSQTNSDEAQDELGPWFVAGLVGTSCIGMAVSVMVHLLSLFTSRSTTASRSAPETMQHLSLQTHQFLGAVSAYMKCIGKDTPMARQSRSSIEFYVASRSKTLDRLISVLPALRAEKYLASILSLTLTCNVDTVKEYAEFVQKQQQHVELIRLSTTQLLLGEEFTSQNELVKDLKTKMSDHLGIAVEEMALEYTRCEHSFFFVSQNTDVSSFEALQSGMKKYMLAMRNAIFEAESILISVDKAGITNISSRSTAGPLVRSRVAFHALYSIVYELREVMHETTRSKVQEQPPTETSAARLKATLGMSWLWNDVAKRRLALKTALGLGLASLWVSIPLFRERIAFPSSIWVGVTVASVSLESTGSSYTKCIDRLWGTLVAAAYALFIGKVFASEDIIARIVFLSAFTFIAILQKNPNRPYASQYAATSVGSVLFGSFYGGQEVDEYVPQRILLIFIGVGTFLFVEMVLFPLSSRTFIQAHAIQYFEDVEHVLFEAAKLCGSISSFQKASTSEEGDCYDCDNSMNDPLFMLRQGVEKMTMFTKHLSEASKKVKASIARAKGELGPGIAEPSLGLNVRLDVVGYDNLFIEQERLCSQIELLITCLQSLIGYYSCLPEKQPVRDLHWPATLSSNTVQVAQQLNECVHKLHLVFPHGLCRPGSCTLSDTIKAVAAFRNFEDVRLSILGDVADRHAAYLSMITASGEEVRYNPGFRLTLALASSAIITIAQCLQNCGLHLETIVRSFPLESYDFAKQTQSFTSSTIRLGDAY